MLRILVIDDDEAMREVLKLRLEGWGHQVRTAEDGREALDILESENPDVIISDVVMPGLSGLQLLEKLKEIDRDQVVILVTARAEVSVAVEAMKKGARDFITKPIEYPQLKALLEEIEREKALRHEVKKLEKRIEAGLDFGPFIGRSKAMREIYRLIQDVADTDASVLISGESGTGKELVARTIHNLSRRAGQSFLAINAAAIPSELMESELFGHEKGAFTGAVSSRAGCFEQAHGGTLFLDEISEMSGELQAKLLRVLEDKTVRRVGGNQEFRFDVRILAATNREPLKAVEEGRLRSDLYYRLNVFNIVLPRLSERTSDIPSLAQYFVTTLNDRHETKVEGITDEVRQILLGFAWPGNVRELRNVIERAVVLAKSGWIQKQHLPPHLRESGKQPAGKVVIPPGTPLDEAEKELILGTLKATGNNKAEAARRLGVDVKTIRNKLKQYEQSE